MAVETALEDRRRTVARVAPQEDDLRSLAVVLRYTAQRLLRLAGEKILAIKLEFPLGAFSSHLHGLGNRREPDAALLIDEQHPADKGDLSGRCPALVV